MYHSLRDLGPAPTCTFWDDGHAGAHFAAVYGWQHLRVLRGMPQGLLLWS